MDSPNEVELVEELEGEPDWRIRITPKQALQILAPYAGAKFWEQVTLVMPVVAYLGLFQLLILAQPIENAINIIWGVLAVLLGLMFFMEGLRLGLMPFAERIGSGLPQTAKLSLVLAFAFLVGIMATFAEPSISALRAAGSLVEPDKAPLLYYLLNNRSTYLILAVGIGVGIAAALGILRILLNWNLTPLILPSVMLTLLLTILAGLNKETLAVIGLAWDTGAVTTGPVTVPLVLALGIGLARVLGRGDTGKAGFGIVTLASLFPIVAVLLLALALHYFGLFDPSKIEASQKVATAGNDVTLGSIVVKALISAVQAIIPLMLFLYLVLVFVVKGKLQYAAEVLLGIAFALFGMFVFNLGLLTGLSPLGGQVGQTLPTAFCPPGQGLYGDNAGRAVAIVFAFILGFGATIAEPALNALGIKVEEITSGAIRRRLLLNTVAGGVGMGIMLGVVKLIFEIPIAYLLVPLYLVLLVITLFSTEEFVNIGWDSAGVTTGPITVPLVIAMGLGLGSSLNLVEGFGILALASVCPIIFVLVLALLARGRREFKEEDELEDEEDSE